MSVDSRLVGEAHGAVTAHQAEAVLASGKEKLAVTGRSCRPRKAGACGFWLRVRCAALAANGDLILDFDKLLRGEGLGTFLSDAGTEVELNRLTMSPYVKDQVLGLFLAEGVPLLFRHADTEHMLAAAMACAKSLGPRLGFESYTGPVAAQAVADAVRLHDAALKWCLREQHGRGQSALHEVTQLFGNAGLGMAMLLAVRGQARAHEAGQLLAGDEGQVAAAQKRLQACAGALVMLAEGLGLDMRRHSF